MDSKYINAIIVGILIALLVLIFVFKVVPEEKNNSRIGEVNEILVNQLWLCYQNNYVYGFCEAEVNCLSDGFYECYKNYTKLVNDFYGGTE